MATPKALPLRGLTARISNSAVLGGILVLGWSLSAFGATHSVANCQDIGNNLRSLNAPTSELTIALVDLPATDAELGLAEPLDPSKATPASTVPFLFLTPRVASKLREVFDEDLGDRDADRLTKIDASFPPIAEGNSDQPSLPSLEETELPSPDETIPRFQRAMYRTDI